MCTCNTISNVFYLWPLNDHCIIYVQAVDQSTSKEIAKISPQNIHIRFFLTIFFILYHNTPCSHYLALGLFGSFLMLPLTLQLHHGWFDYFWGPELARHHLLLLHHKTWQRSYPACQRHSTPSINWKNRIYIMLLYYWIDELSHLYMYMIPLWQTQVVFFLSKSSQV